MPEIEQNQKLVSTDSIASGAWTGEWLQEVIERVDCPTNTCEGGEGNSHSINALHVEEKKKGD
jgi:hypothetical protein